MVFEGRLLPTDVSSSPGPWRFYGSAICYCLGRIAWSVVVKMKQRVWGNAIRLFGCNQKGLPWIQRVFVWQQYL